MVCALVPKARSTKLFGFLFPALPAQSVFSHPQRDTEVLAVVDFKETGPDGKQGCGGQWRRRGRHGETPPTAEGMVAGGEGGRFTKELDF